MSEIESETQRKQSNDWPVVVNDEPDADDNTLSNDPQIQQERRSNSFLSSYDPLNTYDPQDNYQSSSQPQQPLWAPQQSLLGPQQSFRKNKHPFQISQQYFPQQQQPFEGPDLYFPQQQQPCLPPHQSFPLLFPSLSPQQQQQQPSPTAQQYSPLQPRLKPQPSPVLSSGTVRNGYHQYLPLNQAITKGDLNAVKAFLDKQPDAVTASIQENGLTALLAASQNGNVEIVKEILSRMSPDDLIVKQQTWSHTSLTACSVHGGIEIAEALIRKNPKLLEMPTLDGDIPVVLAINTNQKAMARYLYSKTPLATLLDNNGNHGTLLLASAIFFKLLDIALHLVQSCPRLAITMNHSKDMSPICVLATRLKLFPSGTKLGLWQRFIYSRIHVEEPSARLETFDQPRNQGLLGSLAMYFSKILGIHEMRQLKTTHLQAQKLLHDISVETSMLGVSERNQNGIYEAMYLAVKLGNVEFIVEMIKTNPDLFWVSDSGTGSSLFLESIGHRQEKVFSLLYNLDNKKAQVVSELDSFGNGILHYAGFLPPSDRLDSIPGPALQLQRELQWFKEVERILPDVHRESLNSRYMKPRDVFTETHVNLYKEGEKWMKDTSMACSFVAALMVTFTFAAGFTVPGGTEENLGSPLRLKDNRFTFFIISDIISFFSSSTAMLIFLGILTARYAEDDFLVSLPSKMIAGLSLLFFSIAAMLLAFSAALFTLLYQWTWIVIPVILLVCLPVVLFVLLQYPLLSTMIISTYGRGIFDRKIKP